MQRILTPFRSFFRSESFSGILLLAAAVLAVLWANSPWGGIYEAMKALPLGFEVADFRLVKPLLLWINDGLMAVFFLYVGLEIKREVLVGELANRRAAALPAAAALGGMVVPAALYLVAAGSGPAAAGWGVPMATDIAFALGVLALLGDRVPLALKVFLTALAIVDDLGAVMVIALFYTADLAVGALVGSLALWVVLLLYGRSGGRRLFVFLPIGLLLWLLMLKSGVHATVAGVLIAVTVPLGRAMEPGELTTRLRGWFQGGDFEDQEVEIQQLEEWTEQIRSPLHETEHDLQPWVAYCIMPVFALFNAGFPLGGEASLAAPVALGAILGLVVGKPLGILAFSWVAVRLGIATVPASVNWRQIAGAGALAGIGFTMSLFIAALAFGEGALLDQAKLGVMAASVVSAVVGAGVLLTGKRTVRS